jgi:hypothetical protein
VQAASWFCIRLFPHKEPPTLFKEEIAAMPGYGNSSNFYKSVFFLYINL